MKAKTLHDLFLHELNDLYSAEKQILKALPKMKTKATSSELKKGFAKHLEETKGHVKRLEKAFKSIDAKPKKMTCEGMKGLLKEGDKAMKESKKGSVMDAAMISAAQRVEHYEMAGYGTALEFAQLMDHSEAARLLEETLNEEKMTDEKLTSVAKEVNAEANNM